MQNSKPKDNNIHAGHRKRLRNLFLNQGITALDDYQIMELLMFYVHRRKDTNELGHSLINEFGSLDGVFSASYDELKKLDDVGEVGATLITLIGQMRNRIAIKPHTGNMKLSTSDISGEFCCEQLKELSNERFILVSMTSTRRVIAVDIISEGSSNATAVNTRKVLETALKRKAVCVLLAHNHPADSPYPSSSDVAATNRIISVLEGINIDVIDHIICSGDTFVSMEERQLLGK